MAKIVINAAMALRRANLVNVKFLSQSPQQSPGTITGDRGGCYLNLDLDFGSFVIFWA